MDQKGKKKQKAKGKQFESDFADSIKTPLRVYRLKDSTASWGDNCPNCRTKMISMCPTCKTTKESQMKYAPKNICDYVVRNPIERQVHWCELKEYNGNNLSFNNVDITKLKELAYNFTDQYDFEIGWLIVFPKDHKQCYAVRAETAFSFYQSMCMGDVKYGRNWKSWPIEFFKKEGVRIPTTKPRVNWRFDFDVIFSPSW